jgi:hypothetical protein
MDEAPGHGDDAVAEAAGAGEGGGVEVAPRRGQAQGGVELGRAAQGDAEVVQAVLAG